MCLDREPNQQPFGLQATTQSAEPHQPGLAFSLWEDFDYLSSFFDDSSEGGQKMYCIILEPVLLSYACLEM